MRAKQFITEKWTQKYKSSINCSHPKGFSQKAHCAGKKKHNEDVTMEAVCPDCGMCETHGNLNEIAKGAKDSNGVTKCWPGKHAEGTKKGKNGGQVRNCVPNESVDEAAKHGLYYNVNKRKAAGTSRPASSPKAPTAQAWKDAAKTAKKEGMFDSKPKVDWNKRAKELFAKGLNEQQVAQQLIKEGCLPKQVNVYVQAGQLQEDWNKVNHHDKTDGLSQKAVNAYRRENPGSKLKTAVTTKPSKLKAGSKAAKRRKSFCARMGGNKGPMKKPNGKPTPKALALRRWNCESVEEMQELIMLGEHYIANLKENFADGKNPGRNSQLNTLHDPQRMAGAVAYLTDYYDSKEEAYRIIDAYMASVDKLITQGGTVYRAVWVAPGQKPKLKQPGLHWTLTPQSAEEYLQSEAGEYAAMDMDLDDQPHAYILSATVGPNNITNHGVNFAQQHHEQEVGIVDPKQAQIKVVKQVGMTENFADGRNPQDKGDSKRHGINTKASVSSLRKTAKQGGRKGQLAHWMANMKAGKAKHAGK